MVSRLLREHRNAGSPDPLQSDESAHLQITPPEAGVQLVSQQFMRFT